MNTKDFLKILHKPSELQNEQIFDLEDVVAEYPYFQAARVLYLKGLKNQNSFRYNQSLKTTAIYTADRSVLFHFITSNAFHSVLSNKQEKEIIEEIEVRDETIIENIYQNTESVNEQEIDVELDSISINELEVDTKNTAIKSEFETPNLDLKSNNSELNISSKSDVDIDADPVDELTNGNTPLENESNQDKLLFEIDSNSDIDDTLSKKNIDNELNLAKNINEEVIELLSEKDLIEQEINDFFNSRDAEKSKTVKPIETLEKDIVDSLATENSSSKNDQTTTLPETNNIVETLDKSHVEENIETIDFVSKPPEVITQDFSEETKIKNESEEEYRFEKKFTKNITEYIFENTTDKIVLPEYSFKENEEPAKTTTIETKKEQAFSFEIDTHEEIASIEIEDNLSLETSSIESNTEILRFELAQDDDLLETETIKSEAKEAIISTKTLENQEEIETIIAAEKPLEIELDLDITTPIHFNKNDTHSFGDWMQLSTCKPIDRSNQPVNKKAKNMALIDEFMNKNPKIKPHKATGFSVDFNHIEKIEPDIVMTETLANVYISQEKYQNAINAYEILSLKFPEKSSFFADQIKVLTTKLNNTSL